MFELRVCGVILCNIELKNEGKSNRFTSNLICPVNTVCILVVVLASDLHRKSRDLAQTETMLEQRIEQATATHESLVAQEQYMKTNQYIEDMAKEKLGMVYPDEIVIRPKE